ncbi:MAG: SpoIVB peptidase S55 domain-containing protein [Candidatus Omnitrophota bacterium]
MTKKRRISPSSRLMSWVAMVVCFFSFTLRATDIMKLSDVKAGMKGEGKTIFKGTQIETFPFTVLGVLQDYAPNKSIIIIEADCPVLNDTGIIEGMSGSPAYIDGKLVGAIAIGFNFSKKAIGGITPIEDMLKTADYNGTAPPLKIDTSTLKMAFTKENLAHVASFIQDELTRRLSWNNTSSFTPIRLIGLSRGFTTPAPPALAPLFSSGGNFKLTGAHANSLLPSALDKNMLRLAPADAVAISLITGDLEYSALGTVTHVDGNNVFVFGHPFFNMGTIDLPMHKAEVITVVPSYQSSFKLGSIGNVVGHAVQDRFSAVQGELGKTPYMIPMTIALKNKNHTFKFELANHPLLTPVLSAYCMAGIFSSQLQEAGFQSIDVKGKICIEGEKNIVIDDLYSGAESINEFNNLLMAINFFLLNNKEKNVKLQKIDFEVTGSEAVRVADVENVLVDKKSYLPGELMKITVFLKNERGEPFTQELSIPAPNLKPGSDFLLLVADGEEMGKFDMKNVRTNYFPTTLNFLIRAFNNLRKNKNLYLKVMTADEGLFVKGYEYPNLPSSMQDMFVYNKSQQVTESSADEQSKMKYSTLYDAQTELNSVIRGNKLFKLKIKERTDD